MPSNGLVLVLACAILVGCGEKQPRYPTCGGDRDCEEGEHCIARQCLVCGDDTHCKSFETCSAGACVLREGMCETTGDCKDGLICRENRCESCASDVECGPGSRCSSGACVARGKCTIDEDCADEEDCVESTCLRGGRREPPALSCKLDAIYFSYDEYGFDARARDSLQATSVCIQQAQDRNVLLIGHTDERGTDEYNVALSEKRARAVADFLARLGIDPDRLRVIPKGEAEALGDDESSRSRDRRVNFEWQ
jgi:peptidoglycan-associated lipoprotein